MPKPVCAARVPVKVDLEAGEAYYYCTCGKSEEQPFCDGRHLGSGMAPKRFVARHSGPQLLCQCKASEVPPFCDGSHADC